MQNNTLWLTVQSPDMAWIMGKLLMKFRYGNGKDCPIIIIIIVVDWDYYCSISPMSSSDPLKILFYFVITNPRYGNTFDLL